jgi:hypothetical protein
LVVLKSLPRDDRSQRTEESRLPEAVKKERAAKWAWLTASERLLREWNKRFHSAALARSRGALLGTASEESLELAAADEADPFSSFSLPQSGAAKQLASDFTVTSADPMLFGLPLPLHPGAEIAAEYHVQWPADLQGRLKGTAVSPMVIHYVRLEQEDRPAKLLSFYTRQLKSPAVRSTADGRWLDSMEKNKVARSLRSVDVLIQRTRETQSANREATEPLVVEILWIEIPDPT